MFRYGVVAVGVVALSLGAALPASAARPEVVKPAPAETAFTIPADEACGFDVDFVVPKGKGGAILFDSGRAIYISPGLVVNLTNPSNHKSVTYNATGSFHDRPGEELADGSYRFTTKMVGHNLVFGPVDTDAGVVLQMKLYVGRVTGTITVPADGSIPVLSDVDDHAARATDVCALLA